MKELTEKESVEVNGGWFGAFGTCMTVGIYLFNNWDDFSERFSEGYNATIK